MTVVAIIQARMGSSRLPGKVMLPLGGVPVLTHDIRSTEAAESIDETVVATADTRPNDVIEAHARREGVACFRGSEGDVIGRVLAAARRHGATHVVRRSGDHPLVTPAMIDASVDLVGRPGIDLVSNRMDRTFPRGVAVEAFTIEAFERLDRLAGDADRENVSSTYRANRDAFDCADLTVGDVFDDGVLTAYGDLSTYRVVLDEPADYERLWRVYESTAIDGEVGLLEAIQCIEDHGLTDIDASGR